MNKLSGFLATSLISLALHSFANECPVMTGEYIIGSSEEAEFATIGEAFSALQCGGINGPITFLIEDGTYPESLVLGQVVGTSGLNTITLAGVSGNRSSVVVSPPPSDATIVLAGTSYITFEHLTFDHLASTFGNCMRIDGDAHHLTFRDIAFTGVEGPRTGSMNAVVKLTSTSSKSDISFDGCEINNGSFGIFKGNGAKDLMDSKTTITNNSFFNQYEAGISLDNEVAPAIVSNIINTVSTSNSFTGILLNKVSDDILLNKNVVNVANGGTGISLSNCIASEANPGQIIDNRVAIAGNSEAYGIRIAGTTDHQIIDFNTIKLAVTEETAANQAFCKNTSSGKQVTMMNSTFYNLNNGSYFVYTDSFANYSSENTSGISASAQGVK